MVSRLRAGIPTVAGWCIELPNAVAYIRVSTDRQVEDGAGLEVQEQQVRDRCEALGHHLVEIYRDEGISGTKDSVDRPGLAQALTALEGAASILVIPKLDRLARKLTVQEAVLAQAWKSGATVWACDLGEILRDDPDDPMRTAMRQMVAVFSELEARMIAARMRAGRRNKAQKGGYAGYGSPRLGQRAEGRELVADTAEQATIARMIELDRQGLSLRDISRTLTAEGHTPKRGGQWWPEVVRRTLARISASTDTDVAA